MPGGNALLQLADRYRSRAGGAARLEGAGQWIRPLAGGAALQLYGDARLRDSPAASETRYQPLQAGGAWSRPVEGAQGYASVGATQMRYGGAELYRALRLSAGRDWRFATPSGCAGVRGAEPARGSGFLQVIPCRARCQAQTISRRRRIPHQVRTRGA